MSLFKLSGSFRRFARGVLVLLVLPVAFLVIGCDSNGLLPDDPNGPFPGEWIPGAWAPLDGTWLGGGQTYTIDMESNPPTFNFNGGEFGTGYENFAGEIQGVMIFTPNGTRGVIFIRYTDKPTDGTWAPGETDDDPWIFTPGNPPDGDYIGIFFNNRAGNSVQFANPFVFGEGTPATETLAEARNTFTVDREGDFVFGWAGITPSERQE